MTRPAGAPSQDPVARAVRAERMRVAERLHAGVVQQVTALSLAVDTALLHVADGRDDRVRAALHDLRAIADATVADCRALLARLRAGEDA